MDTPRYPLGPSVLPGQYTLKLTAAGRTYTRTLDVAIDPRVKTTRAGLEQQLALSQQTVEGMNATFDALEELGKLRARLKDLRARTGLAPALAESLAALDAKTSALENGPGNSASPQTNLSQLHSRLSSLLEVLQQSDAAATTQAVAASGEFQKQLRELLSAWRQLKSDDVEAVNAQLRAAKLPPLTL
jgi:DNA repair exonuclease SbcCD ATPase subunit